MTSQKILLAPLQQRLAYFLSAAVVICVASVYNTDVSPGRIIMLISDAYLCALLLQFLPHGWSRVVEKVLLSLAVTISLVESFLYAFFDYGYTPSVLMFALQTTPTEAEGFVSTFVLSLTTMRVLLSFSAAVAAMTMLYRYERRAVSFADRISWCRYVFFGIACFFLSGQLMCFKKRMHYSQMFISGTPDSIEQSYASAYSPSMRIAYSIWSLRSGKAEVRRVYEATLAAEVASCRFASPLIFLYIGESYARSHSALYGYPLPTTPCQSKAMEDGNLIVMSDAVSSANYTSLSWKNMLSMQAMADGCWYDAPLFPALLHKAGYKVAFITNQFQQMDNVFAFASSFFLNTPELSRLMFDYRNTSAATYDSELLAPLDTFLTAREDCKFVIFNGRGQHLAYDLNYPEGSGRFTRSDYHFRQDITDEQKDLVAAYDNATLYNDYVVGQIMQRLQDDDAIFIYVADHGERVYDDGDDYLGHASKLSDSPMLQKEFEIPMWFWCSDRYKQSHPDVFSQLQLSRDIPYRTDVISHTIVDLAGISCPNLRKEYSLLSPSCTRR